MGPDIGEGHNSIHRSSEVQSVAMSGILKRKLDEVDGSSPCSSLRESEDDVSSSESGDSSDSANPSAASHFAPASILKREKRMRTRKVHFEKVTVYYFSRRQGFTSVPSQGGSTLGMSSQHCGVRQYTLGEFALEQERNHRDMLRDHLKEEKLNGIKLKLTKNGTVDSKEASGLTVEDISDDDIDLDNTEVDEYFFLQPLTTKKRRALLRASGVKRIDVEEKHELRAIRVSREDCGCDCRIFCDPETCACSMAGIKCQVDRMSFPCGCSKEGCTNTAGRIEFNPIRVRTHFLHTIMKLEQEKSREQQPPSMADGYHGEVNVHGNALVQGQHGLEYTLTDGVPQAAIMHLQAANEMDEAVEEEDEEEEEEEEDNEEEEDEEDEDDGSSLCSGLTDSSTHSLAGSDSEEEDSGKEKPNESVDGVSTAHVSHSEVVPLSSELCYPEGPSVQDNHSNGSPYFSASPAEYYQMKNSSIITDVSMGNRGSDSFGEAPRFQDGLVSLDSFSVGPDPYHDYSQQAEGQYANQCFSVSNGASSVVVCCSPDQNDDDDVQPGQAYCSPPEGHLQLQNFLKENGQELYVRKDGCFRAEPQEISDGLAETPARADGMQVAPSVECLPQVSFV
ncbi:cysteine/serine-rich nuclear protein 3-like isoform X1 [Brienomyrus brachyistius]|uniref:cysteine/serine-rich nuclear protein 3-like isoform X1 n=2 Tax=Brienomyrus brachyistius TaxID=42636 RepID=UPI0020B45DA7|nr:cysteine/serine-rich nuclear protein 3-like isoform X1 [Brienomyrus brachyistius]